MNNLDSKYIETKTGLYDIDRFNALIDLRTDTLGVIRNFLERNDFTEVLTAVLVNIAGSCENPYASFKLPYYGRTAHLSQSAQLQLEKIVVGLKRKVFTVNNSFREENYEDPDAQGRRLSEFTLIEPEIPFESNDSLDNLHILMDTVESIIKEVLSHHFTKNEQLLLSLNSNFETLRKALNNSFQRIGYEEAISILNSIGQKKYSNQLDLGIKEEKLLLQHFDYKPIFVVGFPHNHKLFNLKRFQDSSYTYSFDLLTPQLGECVGGGIREENPKNVLEQLNKSKVGEYIRNHSGVPSETFHEYFNAVNQFPNVPRGGFGIGFERLMGFLIDSNDILNTISYRSFTPV